MNSEIDPNAVMTAVTTDLVKDFFKSVGGSAASAFNKRYQKYFPQFESHLAEIYDRVSNVKILCCPDAPTPFSSIYVCPTLRHADEVIDDQGFLDLAHKGSKLIVKSHGGSGKTFLMRHLWLQVFEAPQGRVPILIELRGLNEQTTIDLMSYIRASAVKAGSMSEEIFINFCKDGKFIFLFDGFDEIEKKQRDIIEAQILKMTSDFHNCAIVVTGRPNDRFASWSAFKTYSCRPFSYDQFSELIENVPFDGKSKRKFQKVATEAFFNRHKDFLSNPLLAQMMLMTYRDNAEIPNKLAIFYENCYLTLFLRHDALKEQLRRPKLLDQDEFRRLFSVFCFFSYLKSKPDFTDEEIRDFIRKSIERCNFTVSVDQVLEEFLETVNLIQKDGTRYQFIHRSFQEYFAAHCCVRVLSEQSRKILKFFADQRADTTFELAYELHPDLVISEYFIPEFNDLRSAGYFGPNAKILTPIEITKMISMEVIHVIMNSSEPQYHTQWNQNQDYELFSQVFEKAMGLKNTAQFVGDHIFALHRNLTQLVELVSKSGLAKDTIVTISMTSDGEDIVVECTTDREYKRPPKILSEIRLATIKHTSKEFLKIGKCLVERRAQIDTEMASMVKKHQQNLDDLAADFGI